MRIHHIGYAVPSIADAEKRMLELGFSARANPVEDKQRNIMVLFMEHAAYCVELIAPLDPAASSPVDGILSKKMPGPYHICYEVESLDDAIMRLKQQGWLVIAPPLPACALMNTNVVFLFEKTLGIIELVEKTRGGEWR